MSELIQLIQGDITKIEVDVIVNAANSRLAGGGGVDGAIHRAAGPELLKACKQVYNEQGECLPGNAVMTSAFALPAKYVFHAVGPIWRGGTYGELEQLFNVYIHCLELAQEQHCRSIAFPNISTGIYGFPKDKAADIALSALMDFFTQRKGTREAFDKVFLVCFDNENYEIYNQLLYAHNKQYHDK